MKLFLLAGEASGDLHTANLAKALRQIYPDVKLMGWGGDHMEAAGVKVLKHYRELAFMGFWEVAKNIRTILQNFKLAQQQIMDFAPDRIVLVDYPGFNLRMAKWAKKQQIPVTYYIAPQLWAWHSSRAKQIKAYVDQLLVILPFEVDFYRQLGIEAYFTGHPLLDAIQAGSFRSDFRAIHQLDERPILALLPGSRKQEIERILPVMVDAASRLDSLQSVVAVAPGRSPDTYWPYLKGTPIRLVEGQTYDLLSKAHLAAVTSGTATLETALFGVPQVVCYKSSALTYQLARHLVKVKYISLVNLILDRPLLSELIQGACKGEGLAYALEQIATGPDRQVLLDGYDRLREVLGESGASEQAARSIVHHMEGAKRG